MRRREERAGEGGERHPHPRLSGSRMGETESSEFRETGAWNPQGWSRGLRESGNGRQNHPHETEGLGCGVPMYLALGLGCGVPMHLALGLGSGVPMSLAN